MGVHCVQSIEQIDCTAGLDAGGIWQIPYTKGYQVDTSYTGWTVQAKAHLGVLTLWVSSSNKFTFWIGVTCYHGPPFCCRTTCNRLSCLAITLFQVNIKKVCLTGRHFLSGQQAAGFVTFSGHNFASKHHIADLPTWPPFCFRTTIGRHFVSGQCLAAILNWYHKHKEYLNCSIAIWI